MIVWHLIRAAFCWAWRLPAMFFLAARGWIGTRSAPEAAGETWDLIVISHVEWAHAWQRNQHTMSRMAKDRRVLYCFPLKGALLRDQWRNALNPLRHDATGVWLYHPLVIPGARVSPVIERLNAWLLAGCLRALARRIGIRRPVLWFYFPDQLDLIGRLEERAVVYDIQDDYTRFVWASPVVDRREQALLARADQVFTGTHALLEKHGAAARRIRFIPCGVDFAFFNDVRHAPLPLPARCRDLRAPVLGYFGLVDSRIDLPMIAEIARRRPEWTFAMLGPEGESAMRGIDFPRNVIFFGHVPYAQLPAHAQTFDVCLMPFVLNDLTRAINPTKTLEYFALERPVVSSRIPDVVRFYGEVVSFADGADEWEAAIARALEGDATRVARGVEIARGRSWEAMTREFAETIEEAMRT